MSEPEVTLRFELTTDWCRSEIHDDEDNPALCTIIGGVAVCSVCIADYFEGWDAAAAAYRAMYEWREERASAIDEAQRIINAQENP